MSSKFIISIITIVTLVSCNTHPKESIAEKESAQKQILQDSITKLNKKILSQQYTIEILNKREENIVKEETLHYWTDATTIGKLSKKGINDPEIQKIILELTVKMKELSNENKYLTEAQLPTYWFDSTSIESLIEKGIKNPRKDIIRSLKQREYLLSEDAILGGTMRFSNISLLGNRWAIADADDGHTALYYLFRYQVQNNGSLKWTVIDKVNIFD